MENFLIQLFIYFAAASIAVPLAKKLGLGSVLGYLIAGIVIGPFGFSLISEVEEVMHFTEFGVVMMLFLVGLELKPSLLWKMKTPILGMGGIQVIISAVIIGGVSTFFVSWQESISIGLILALSSTAIVLQTLQEKGLMNTNAGRASFSVLLFQDLAVIPILAILPLLAKFHTNASGHSDSLFFDIKALPGYLQILVTTSAILLVFFLGKFASKPIFRAIAKTKVREIFVAASLALVVGISLLMTAVGLSPALGTFLAGVVLADSEYRHELESDINPFKGLLLGIFFISIGASLNFTLIKENIILILCLTLGLLLIKWIVLYIIGLSFKMSNKTRGLFAISLAQGGEFAFVLFQFSKSNGVLQSNTIDPLVSAVAISMFLSPLLFTLFERIYMKPDTSSSDRESDIIDNNKDKVILAGFGRVGLDLGRFLISVGIKPVIIDHNAENVDILRKFGFEVYYGDITRLDLLEAAGIENAKLMIITMGEFSVSKHIIELVQKHYPELRIVTNASDRSTAYELMDLGITSITRETFGSALDLGMESLKILGFDSYDAYRKMRIFRKKDEEEMPVLYKIHREEQEKYISSYQKHLSDLEELMSFDDEHDFEEIDKAWTVKNPQL